MTDKLSKQELKIRTMFVSERLEMRLQGSPEPENDKGYTMYPNWQLRMEITDAEALEQRVERLEDGFEKIAQWAKAYPLDVFPEPDFEKAAQVLKDAGLTLDGISASNMRHVIEGVGEIAKEALAEEEA